MCLFKKRRPYAFTALVTEGRTDGLHFAIATDVGNIRANNEDSALACIPASAKGIAKRGSLFLLADGMGGHNSGEVASDIAVKTFSEYYYHQKGNVKKAMLYAIQKANDAVYKASCQDVALKGMGTTLTAVSVHQQKITLAHTGDSRCYIFKNDTATQLSRDHTWVQHLLQNGEITAEEIKTHPQRNMLVSALGIKPEVEADIVTIDEAFEPEDTLLLCSDGLYEYITEQEMLQSIQQHNNIQQCATSLVTIAKERGGHDNITVVIAAGSNVFSIRKLKGTAPG